MTVNELIQELRAYDADDEVTSVKITVKPNGRTSKLEYSAVRAKRAARCE